LIEGSRSNDLGDLRPGRERTTPGSSSDILAADARDFSRPVFNGHGRSRKFPLGWLVIALIAACSVASVYLPHSMQVDARILADKVAVAAGFGVDHVAVVGHNKTSMHEISAALDLDTQRSLLAFDGAEVRRKLATLPWVETVRVAHILPDTLSIAIIERTPFAVWQRNGQQLLVDRAGNTLGPVDTMSRTQHLPLVVGKGAGVHAGTFIEHVSQHPEVARRMMAAVRVADRRWNIQFRTGEKILLPETGLRSALSTLQGLIADDALKGARVAHVDLRIAARPTLRLQKDVSRILAAMKARRHAAAARQGGSS